MNKRDFIVHGGGALLAGASWQPVMGCPAPTLNAAQGQPRTHLDWQDLQGSTFDTCTPLGRPLTLVLTHVSTRAPHLSEATSSQFTVTLQGPRSLPLQAGMHMLHHPDTGTVALYLEPVSHGEQITYDAHFNLSV